MERRGRLSTSTLDEMEREERRKGCSRSNVAWRQVQSTELVSRCLCQFVDGKKGSLKKTRRSRIRIWNYLHRTSLPTLHNSSQDLRHTLDPHPSYAKDLPLGQAVEETRLQLEGLVDPDGQNASTELFRRVECVPRSPRTLSHRDEGVGGEVCDEEDLGILVFGPKADELREEGREVRSISDASSSLVSLEGRSTHLNEAIYDVSDDEVSNPPRVSSLRGGGVFRRRTGERSGRGRSIGFQIVLLGNVEEEMAATGRREQGRSQIFKQRI